jgi:DNA transformation protein
MPRRSDFVEFVAEQMAFIGGLRIRAMFGGYGIYRDDHMFALIADDRLYFKADPTTRAEFEARGLGPFTYVSRGKSTTMQYFEAPPDVFEDREAMRTWAQKAYATALKAKQGGRKR